MTQTVVKRLGGILCVAMFLLSGCYSSDITLLTSLPEDLVKVVEDPASFDDGAHPLREVVPGTPIDGPESLAGCWGSIEHETIEGRQVVEAQTFRIDRVNGTVLSSLYQGFDGVAFPHFARPTVRVFSERILSDDSGSLSRKIEHISYAGVSDTGRLVYDFDAEFSAGLDEGVTYSRIYTIDGDFMIVDDHYPDGDVDLFVRFECP